jgi:hypothetical protein
LATPLDIDLAAAVDATDLLFPVRARFITCPQTHILVSICLAYGEIKIRSHRLAHGLLDSELQNSRPGTDFDARKAFA